MKELLMNNWDMILIIVMALIVFLIGFINSGENKKDYLMSLVLKLALLAETEFIGKGRGKEKIEYFDKLLNDKIENMPFTSRLLIRLFVKEDSIKIWLNEALLYINGLQRENGKNIKNIARNVLERTITDAIETKFAGNKNMIDNAQLIQIKNTVNSEIEKGQLQTYVRGALGKAGATAEAGLSAIIKF